MNELVLQVRTKLKGKNGVGVRLPYWLGLILGYAADFVSTMSGKNLPVSAIRVKKFASPTEFRTAKATWITVRRLLNLMRDCSGRFKVNSSRQT